MAGFDRHCSYRRLLHSAGTVYEDKYTDCGALGAYPYGQTVRFSVKLPKNAKDARLAVKDDESGKVYYFPVIGGSCDIKTDSLCGGRKNGLFFYKFLFETTSGLFEAVKDKDGISDVITYANDDFSSAFHLLIYKKRKTPPSSFYGEIMYQIFTDRFSRGGNEPKRENAKINPDWYNGIPPYVNKPGERLENNVFFGGDLYGIINKLDYISSLGAGVIYLNPVFEAYSNHKYDTGDYTKIDEMFGGEEAFSLLLKECKKRGIKLILDGVFNHTGDDSVYFNKKGSYGNGGAYRDKSSPYYEWYSFSHYPDKYESWWGIDVLPRVKSDTPSFKKLILGENGVIRTRIRQGVSGWRLDVADELSDGFIKELKTAAAEEKDDVLIIGEVWEDASEKIAYGKRRKYLQGEELDSVMNYPIRKAIISYLRDGNFTFFLKTVTEIYENYPPEVSRLCMNSVGTHDTERIITALAADLPDGKSNDELAVSSMTGEQIKKGIGLVKKAALISYVLPGIPCIYYGDEAGMQGYKDPFNRRPYPWGKENAELLSFYRKAGSIRKAYKNIFAFGSFCITYIDADILCIEREYENNLAVLVINRGGDKYEYSSKEISDETLSGETGKKHIILPFSNALMISPLCDYSVYIKKENHET